MSAQAKSCWDRSATVAILGLGLIGGSLAAALKAQGQARVCAYARRAETLEQARSQGAIDDGSVVLPDAVRGADLIVLAVPMLSMERVLADLRDCMPEAALLTDVGSVKAPILLAADRVFGRRLANLVPGHPIAGSERSGFGARDAALFRGRPVALTPGRDTDPDALAQVSAMWEAVGARVVLLSPERHDALLAQTSHLPHLLASGYVASLSGPQRDWEALIGAGFRDFSRIAASDPLLWRDIMLANREAVLSALALFQTELSALRCAIERGDGEALIARLALASELRRRQDG